MHRRLRRAIAAWLAFCVLLAQSAAIAYACPREAPSPDAAVPCASHLADETGDDTGALPRANVCEVHCQTSVSSGGGAPDVPPALAIVAWLLPVAVPAAGLPAPYAELEARSAAPPPLERFARLLI